MPSASYDGSTPGSGGLPTYDDDTMRTFGGLEWPTQCNVAPDIVDFFVAEDSAGREVRCLFSIEHADGFDACTIWCEGNSVSAVPAILPAATGGVQMYALGCILQSNPIHNTAGYVDVWFIGNPKRGYTRAMSVRVWLNTAGKVARPKIYIDRVNGIDDTASNRGQQATPYKHFNYGIIQNAAKNPSHLTTGYDVVLAVAGNHTSGDAPYAGTWSDSAQIGPITISPGVGLNAGDATIGTQTDGDGSQVLNIIGRRIQIRSGVWIDCTNPVICSGLPGVQRYINSGGTLTLNGNLIFGDGTRVFDPDGAGGKLHNGYPVGFAPPPVGNSFRANRFFDPNGNGNRVSFCGTPANPARLDLTHCSGALEYINCDFTLGWSGPFPTGDRVDSNFRIINTDILGKYNAWFRTHSTEMLTVQSVASVTKGSRTIYEVAVAEALNINAPVLSDGSSGINAVDSQHYGQHFARAFGNSVAVGGGTNDNPGGLDPANYLPNRDGSQDMAVYGWSICGFDQSRKVVQLNSNPVGLTAGDSINCTYAHGHDAFFPQTGSPSLPANGGNGTAGSVAQNWTLHNYAHEHPEAYMPWQWGTTFATGSGTVSGNHTTRVLTFTASQTLFKYSVIRITSGAFAESRLIVRKVLSGTTAEICKVTDSSGNVLDPFTADFSGATFEIQSCIAGLHWINVFMWSALGSGNQWGSNVAFGFKLQNTTMAIKSAFTWDWKVVYGPNARSDKAIAIVASMFDSYQGAWQFSGDAGTTGNWFPFWVENNEFGKQATGGPILDNTVGTSGFTGTPRVFTSSTKGDIARTASAKSWPVDMTGAARVVGTSKVGA